MIEFRVEQETPPPSVTIKTCRDDDGEVQILANGIAVLWFKRNGTVMLNSQRSTELSEMGFRTHNDRIVVK